MRIYENILSSLPGLQGTYTNKIIWYFFNWNRNLPNLQKPPEEEEIVIPSLDDSLDVVISNPFKKSTSNYLVSKNEPNQLDPPGVIDDETRGIKTGDHK